MPVTSYVSVSGFTQSQSHAPSVLTLPVHFVSNTHAHTPARTFHCLDILFVVSQFVQVNQLWSF